MSAPLQTELLLRFGLAALLGAVLGWDRQLGRHAAGLRVHVLVALGAAVYTVAGVYGVAGLGTVQDARAGGRRRGLPGAGTIWRSRDDRVIYGLTTAASIWLAAGLGMLAAYGLYFLAVGGALLGVAVLWAMKPLERAALALPRPALTARPRRAPDRALREGPHDLRQAPSVRPRPGQTRAPPRASIADNLWGGRGGVRAARAPAAHDGRCSGRALGDERLRRPEVLQGLARARASAAEGRDSGRGAG